MKTLVAFIGYLLIVHNVANALNRTSTTDGNWNDPSIWFPTGVPSLTDDTVFVNHSVSIDQKLVVNGIVHLEITSAGCLYSQSGQDTLNILGNTSVLIDGGVSVGYFINQAESLTLNGNIISYHKFSNLTGIDINANGKIECYKYSNSELLIHYGEIKANYFINLNDIDGNGKICVSDTMRNQQDINGTIDICDATPNGPGDYNIGTIAPTVTYCAVSPCGNNSVVCSALKIDELNESPIFTLFPNPVSTKLYIQSNYTHGSNFILRNCYGQTVFIGNSNSPINVAELPAGLYFLEIENTVLKIIKE